MICTVRPGGTVDTATAVFAPDDAELPEPHPASSDPAATAADSHTASFRMMRRGAACNWLRTPNGSFQGPTDTPGMSTHGTSGSA